MSFSGSSSLWGSSIFFRGSVRNQLREVSGYFCALFVLLFGVCLQWKINRENTHVHTHTHTHAHTHMHTCTHAHTCMPTYAVYSQLCAYTVAYIRDDEFSHVLTHIYCIRITEVRTHMKTIVHIFVYTSCSQPKATSAQMHHRKTLPHLSKSDFHFQFYCHSGFKLLLLCTTVLRFHLQRTGKAVLMCRVRPERKLRKWCSCALLVASDLPRLRRTDSWGHNKIRVLLK